MKFKHSTDQTRCATVVITFMVDAGTSDRHDAGALRLPAAPRSEPAVRLAAAIGDSFAHILVTEQGH